MKRVNPMAEDSFVKAREAFFGTAKTSPKPSAPPAELPNGEMSPRPQTVTGHSSDEHEPTLPSFSFMQE